ncbi:MAG: preprotein translocase subunit SecE [Lentisphaeria bacterium]|nr:preprotein translocase subunit SecE [Lentisphaeria bacterium]
MRSELKKVIWPTPKQIVNNTLVALLVMVVCALVIWGFDELASAAVKLLISLGA